MHCTRTCTMYRYTVHVVLSLGFFECLVPLGISEVYLWNLISPTGKISKNVIIGKKKELEYRYHSLPTQTLISLIYKVKPSTLCELISIYNCISA